MNTPANVAMAAFVAIIGGLVSIAFLATALINSDNFQAISYNQAGFALLFAALFFGFAGMCYPDGKGDYNGMIIVGLLTIISIAIAIVIEPKDVNLYFGIALFVIAAIQVILVLPSVTEKWVKVDRA